MIARIGIFEGGQHASPEGVRTVEERLLPILSGVPGFISVQWLVDREQGRSLSVSFWDTEAAARNAEQRLRETPLAPEHVRLIPSAVETYEVVASSWGPGIGRAPG